MFEFVLDDCIIIQTVNMCDEHVRVFALVKILELEPDQNEMNISIKSLLIN